MSKIRAIAAHLTIAAAMTVTGLLISSPATAPAFAGDTETGLLRPAFDDTWT